MKRYWLSLGANLGDSIGQLCSAIDALEPLGQIVEVSSLYETDPVGPVSQDCFINLCLAIDSPLAPLELLKATQQIEQDHHRKREIHWGPRTLDIDLLMTDVAVSTQALELPHPRMLDREFVLIPLGELACAPDLPIGYPNPVSDTVRKLNHPAFPRR